MKLRKKQIKADTLTQYRHTYTKGTVRVRFVNIGKYSEKVFSMSKSGRVLTNCQIAITKFRRLFVKMCNFET